MYVDNCANCHIYNDIFHFIDYKASSLNKINGCSTVGGGANAVGEGTVRWSWRNDNGEQFSYDLPNCKYYPNSPVYILSQTQLGLHLNDKDFGTRIESGIYSSKFHWDDGK